MSFEASSYGELVASSARVLTWNVWGRFGPWEARASTIAQAVQATGADIVLLQECWFEDSGADQASQLGDALGFAHCFGGGSLLFETWGLGNAVLSRWPISDMAAHPLPSLGDGWGGLALRAVVRGPRRPILVYNVALDWPPSAGAARAPRPRPPRRRDQR